MMARRGYWSTLAVASALFSGCAGGEAKAGLAPEESDIVSVEMSAAATAIDAGQSVTIRALGRTSTGTLTPVSLEWTVSGGSVVPVSDSEAQFSATAAGSYWVRARALLAPVAVDSVNISVTLPVSPTVGLSVAPATAALVVGDMQMFTASATRQDGSVYTPSVTWSATGGTIGASGLYAAGSTPGTFRVVAIHQGGNLADTSAVTITAALPVLQAVILTPASVSLQTGSTQQFTVSGQWSDGSTTAPAVTWSATGGTVNASGLYAAGNTAGTFRVIARRTGGTLADTSSITITSVAPPPGDLGQIPELPAGYTLYRTHSGSPLVPTGWSSDGTSSISVQVDAQAPRSPTDILRVTYQAGYAGGGEPVKFWAPLGGVNRIFFTYWIRYSSNFEGHSSRINKNVFLFHSTANDYYTTARFSGNASSMYFDIQLQNMSPGFVWLTEQPSGVEKSVAKDQWHRVSVESIRQTSGSNGVLRMWVDGTLVGQMTNVSYPDSFAEFQIAPTWGGIGGSVPGTQWFEIDELRVYLP